MFGVRENNFEPSTLERFRHFQRIAFDVLESVGATLKAGESEKAVARRIHKQMKIAGAQNFFHVPVALFGERTAYPGDFGQLEALPTDRLLAENEAVILDAAPIFDGHTIDTSYAMRFGKGGVPTELDRALQEFREEILQGVKQGLTMRQIARQVDAEIKAKGLENCHRKHIGMVLGHRVTCEQGAFLRGKNVWGLGPRQTAWIVTRSLQSMRGRPDLSPNWNHTRQSDCLTPDGLWAIEPHVARGNFGAKFEEILVVQDGEAYYLDDDLPHTRRWKQARGKRSANSTRQVVPHRSP
jgi:Xaa-Pro aminopeptidase